MSVKYFDLIKTEDGARRIIEESLVTLYKQGGINAGILEVLTHIKIKHPKIFEGYEQQILVRLGLFFKNPEIESFEDNIFRIYQESVRERFDKDFTPVQADIVKKIKDNKAFSFSAPTSTGKSYIFRHLLTIFENDIVIIVPSRALINEYYKRVTDAIDDKRVNIQTFVDKINTKRTKRNIFIITPERTKDLFNKRNEFVIDMILFDEAQLSEDKGIRGMYYDSVIRRAVRYFTETKFVFAYPFVENPSAQFVKNNIDFQDKLAMRYEHRNVGQAFYTYKLDKKDKASYTFFAFGISKDDFGFKVHSDDPLEETLKSNGTALIYCSKRSIYKKTVFENFTKYIEKCSELTEPAALDIIDKIRIHIGAIERKNEGNSDYDSLMVRRMKRGIVVHHGSLPLTVRILIEEFVQRGYCRLCFATSTLEQGINMPFDLVWIDRWDNNTTSLKAKNLVGRAGRSTNESKFDFGKVVTKNAAKLRGFIGESVVIDKTSQLDDSTDPNDEYKEYKEAIKTGQFSEEYNLTNTELVRVQDVGISKIIEEILELVFSSERIYLPQTSDGENNEDSLTSKFKKIYSAYLGRSLAKGEEDILNTTIKILFWRVQGRKFNEIVRTRYSFAAQTIKRGDLRKKGSDDSLVQAGYLVKFDNIPKKSLESSWSFTHKQLAKNVDYDSVVTDTYDYIDKLIGFRVGDVYFAAFDKYAKNDLNDAYIREKAIRMTNYIKYGTDKEIEIWLLRYGFEFEDFDWLLPIVESVSEEEIVFKSIENLNIEQRTRIEKFI